MPPIPDPGKAGPEGSVGDENTIHEPSVFVAVRKLTGEVPLRADCSKAPISASNSVECV